MSSEAPMLAVRVHGPGDLRVERVPRPSPGAGDVLLKVLAAGVCATDRKIVARGQADESRPLVPGHEIVAELIEPNSTGRRRRVVVAPNVGCGNCWQCRRGSPNYCLENRAFGIHFDGGMAEYLLVPPGAVAAGHLLDIPDELSDVDAALVEPLACCVESLAACELTQGESVLIIGGGVMGRLHVTLAKEMGAGTVAFIDRHEERLRHARQLGADVTILAEGTDTDAAVALAWDAADLQSDLYAPFSYGAAAAPNSAADGFDVVIVTIGQAAAVRAGQRHLASGGRLNVFGGLPKSEGELTLDGNALHYRNQSVLGTTGASMSSLRQAIDLLATGGLVTDGLISAVYPLAEAPAAFAAAGQTEHARVVLVSS